MRTDDLVQALGGTETRRSHANDENINVTMQLRSVERLEEERQQRLEPWLKQTHMSAPMVGGEGGGGMSKVFGEN